ncbi:hypothetical protein DENSPDRAFT_884069 [Dentipellis sp. KUC8613]|nr:hypothetical protein DENSPDRAFT_884069 [Dentipellis sp. KUC8613]
MSLMKHFKKVIAPYFRESNGLAKILSGLEGASLGERAWPARLERTDVRIGIRCDYGKAFEAKGRQFRWLHVQANKGAEQNILRRIAQKNSHTVLGSIKIDIKARMGQDEFLEELQKILGGL